MKRFTIVAALVLSPLNGLWLFCQPAEGSVRVEQSASDRCQHVCPPHGEQTCFASSENQMVAPMAGVALGPICAAVTPVVPSAAGEPVAEVSAPLQDLSLSPLSPPPKT